MKQVQIVQNLSPGGIETMALDLKRFSVKPEQTLLVSLEGTRESLVANWPRLKPLKDNIIGLDKAPGLSFKTLFKLARLLKKYSPDVVHTHHIGPLIYGGLAARLTGCKTLIHTEHDAWHLQSPRRRLVAGQALRLTRPLLVADAQVVANEITKHLGVSAKTVIKNGIDTEKFRPGERAQARQKLGLKQEVTMIGCAARLIPVKGHRVLLKSLANIREDVHLALAGDGELNADLKKLSAQLDIEDRVHWLGNIDDMPSFYQAIDVACLPSYQEGFPLSLLEAQACGIPVVASDTGGVHETLCPENSRLVTCGDVDLLAQAICEVVEQSHGQNRHSVAWALRDFVRRNNDVRDMAGRYHALALQWGKS